MVASFSRASSRTETRESGAAEAEAEAEVPDAGSAAAEEASRKQGQRMRKEDLDEIRMLKEQAKREWQEAAGR